MTGRKLIQWLNAQGAKPLDPATRKRLAAADHLGLPDDFSMSAFQLFSFCPSRFQLLPV
jgi:hypothetical protein